MYFYLFNFICLIYLINSVAQSIHYCMVGSLKITEFRHMTSFQLTNIFIITEGF